MNKHRTRVGRSSLGFLAIGLYLTWAAICAAQAADARFSLLIATPRANVRVGNELRLDIMLTNISGQEYPLGVEIESNHAELDYEISVLDRDGNSAPKVVSRLLPSGKPKPRMGLGSHYSRVMKPGASIEEHAILNKLYDLTKPGKYSIQVKRNDPDTKKTITSNTLTIMVDE